MTYEPASSAVKKVQRRKLYDIEARCVDIQPSDRILVIVDFDGTHKLANKWEDVYGPSQHRHIYLCCTTGRCYRK